MGSYTFKPGTGVKPPEAKPPTRMTPHNVRMSERMSRVYGFLQNNGVHLTPFSTDQDVERLYHTLVKLRDWVRNNPQHEAVGEDMDCIMRRRPQARVK